MNSTPRSSASLYIGLMSGTSLDGIDAALIDFSASSPKLIAHHNARISTALRTELLSLCNPGNNEIDRMGQADTQLARCFAQAANDLLAKANVDKEQVAAIGSHGQTIRHRPEGPSPFTLQIGDPSIIAQMTGITTVGDFRRRDMAAGGQAAPLAPAFHNAVFRSASDNRAILNIGGMANLTLLPAGTQTPVIGFDTGPGNVLMDYWCHKHTGQPYDTCGQWAQSGTVIEPLLSQLLNTEYFRLAPPKSTGRELFNADWLDNTLSHYFEQHLGSHPSTLRGEYVEATLLELTAQSISQAISSYASTYNALYICGGGAHNGFLLQRLRQLNETMTVENTSPLGIEPDWVEAAAFAWMAKQTLNRQSSNLPSVTGASEDCILGGVYFA